MPTELHDALMRISGTASATNVTHTISRVQGAVAAGGRAALLKLSSSELRTYGHAIGISSKGLQPELALRIWQHLEQAKAPRDSSELCTHDHADRNGLQPAALHQTIGKQSITSTAAPCLSDGHMRRTSSGRCCAHLYGKQQGDTDLWAEPIRCRNANRAAALSETARRIRGFLLRRLSYGPIGASLKISLDYLKTAGFPAVAAHQSFCLLGRQGLGRQRCVLSRETQFLQACGTLRSASLTFCSRRMEVHAGKLDMAVMEGHVPTAWYTTPGECHQSCQNSHSCERSVGIYRRRRHRLFIMLAFNYPALPDTPIWSTLVRLQRA